LRASLWLGLLAVTLIVLTAAPYALTQQQAASDVLSYRAFSALATAYREGGQTPGLVAKLNQALTLEDEAHLRLLQGNVGDATRLQAQANSILTDILNEVPSLQQSAANERTARTWVTVGLIPVTVLLSTLLFYAFLLVYRRYEKSRLFEMRIIRVAPNETKD